MKIFHFFWSSILIFGSIVLMASCSQSISNPAQYEDLSPVIEEEIRLSTGPDLVIIGEGGPSKFLFEKVAQTYARSHEDAQVYKVNDGDGVIDAMQTYYDEFGPIGHLEFFGHGNHIALFVNQEPGVHGSLYTNDPALNANYRAASVFELPPDIFATDGTVRFNGCNVADGYPESPTFASIFANYFDVSVQAPRGPTEFSQVADAIVSFLDANYLTEDFEDDIYLVPTYADKPFITIEPGEKVLNYNDVRDTDLIYSSIQYFEEQGIDIGLLRDKGYLYPYNNVRVGDLRNICQLLWGPINEQCSDIDGEDSSMVRNLVVLQVLIDASGLGEGLKRSTPWYTSYLSYARERGFIDADFANLKWITKSHMIEIARQIHESQ